MNYGPSTSSGSGGFSPKSIVKHFNGGICVCNEKHVARQSGGMFTCIIFSSMCHYHHSMYSIFEVQNITFGNRLSKSDAACLASWTGVKFFCNVCCKKVTQNCIWLASRQKGPYLSDVTIEKIDVKVRDVFPVATKCTTTSTPFRMRLCVVVISKTYIKWRGG